MISLLRTALLASTIFAATFASAQCSSALDITVIPNQENQLEVWVRPQGDFNQFFSSIVFTLKWLNSGGVTLGSILAQPPFGGLGASGFEHEAGPYKYQVYYGLDIVNFAGIPESFEAGEEMLLAKINVINGPSYFEIGDDDYTSDVNVNGEYYVSLNGQDCTGEIYTFSTGGVIAGTAAPEVTVSPNPTAGLSTINVILALQADLNFELFDPAGRRIWQQERKARTGQHVEQLSMQGMADGVYLLQVHVGDRITTHRVVLGGGKN